MINIKIFDHFPIKLKRQHKLADCASCELSADSEFSSCSVHILQKVFQFNGKTDRHVLLKMDSKLCSQTRTKTRPKVKFLCCTGKRLSG